jgi:uncharacterized protein involved in outer membrane biogenesis
VLLSVFAACVVLVVAAAVVFHTAYFRRFAASFLISSVKKYTGSDLTIGQLPVLRLGLAPALVAQDVALSVGTGTEQGVTVSARRIELQTRILPLLHGRIEVERLVVTGLDVALDTTEKPKSAEASKAATQAVQPSLPKGVSSLLSGLDLGELLITDSSLNLCDRTSGKQTRVAVDHLRLAREPLAPRILDAEVVAAFNGIPISLSGTLGGPAALVSTAEPFPLDVVVKTDGAMVGVEGRIEKVWSLEGIDIAVQAEVSDPAALGRALGVRLGGRGPWGLDGRVRDTGSAYEVDPLTVMLGGSTLMGSVRVGGKAGVSLKLSGEGIDLARLLEALGVKGGPSGRVGEFAADAQTIGGTPHDWVTNLAGQVRVARGTVVVGAGTRIEVERANVVAKADGSDVEVKGSVRGMRLTVAGTVGSVAELAFGGKPFPVDVVAKTEATTVRVDGRLGGSRSTLKLSGEAVELGPLLAVLGVKSEVSGRVGALAADVRTSGKTPKDWVTNLAGQVRVTQGNVLVGGGTRIEVERANVVTEAGGVGVEAVGSVAGVPLSVSGTVGGVEALAFGGKPFPVKVAVGTSGGTVAVDGTIGMVWALREVDVGVKAEVDDPAALGRVLGARLPAGGPWRVEGRVHDMGSGYAVEPLHVVLGGDTLSGSMRWVDESEKSLKLSGSEIELAPLLAALGVKAGVSGRVGEFRVDVRTSGRTPREWVTNLAGRVHVGQGSVLVGAGTRIEAERANLVADRGGLDVDAVGSVGGVPLSVKGTVGTVEALAFGGNPVPVKVAVKTDGAAAAIDGVIAHPWSLSGADVGVRAEVTDPAALGRVLGARLPGSGSWRVEGEVRDTGNGYEVDGLTLATGDSTLTGRVGLDTAGARPKVTVELSSPLLDASDFGAPTPPEEARADQAPSPAKQGPVFSSTPLPLHGLEAADGEVALGFQRLARRDHVEIGGLTLRALLADGNLVVEPIELRTTGGTITGSVRLDEAGNVSVSLMASAIKMGALVTILGGTIKTTGGATDVRVNLRSAGHSLHEWIANLKGEARIVVGPGRLEGEKIDLGIGVMNKLMELINPFQKEDKHTDLRCAVVNASIEKGVVDFTKRVVFETAKFTAIGTGTVDLGREVLDVDVWAKSSLSLSAGLSNFSARVKLKGPLRKPSLAVNAKGAATTALSVGGTVATAGLWLIGENLWTKIATKAHCQDALAASAPVPASTEVPEAP